MTNNKKNEFNNSWAGSNVEFTDKSKENRKTSTNNQWVSTNKKDNKGY